MPHTTPRLIWHPSHNFLINILKRKLVWDGETVSSVLTSMPWVSADEGDTLKQSASEKARAGLKFSQHIWTRSPLWGPLRSGRSLCYCLHLPPSPSHKKGSRSLGPSLSKYLPSHSQLQGRMQRDLWNLSCSLLSPTGRVKQLWTQGMEDPEV